MVPGADATGLDKPLISADPDPTRADRVYVHWNVCCPAGAASPLFQRSLDAGDNWLAAPLVLDKFPQGTAFDSASAIGPDGEVYLVWLDLGVLNTENDERILLRRSDNAGAENSWWPPIDDANYVQPELVEAIDAAAAVDFRLPPTYFRVSASVPSVAVDRSNGPSRGRVYVCFDREDPGGDTNIYVRAGNWVPAAPPNPARIDWVSAPVLVNDDTTNDQFFPWVAVDDYGRVGVMWYDRRNDADDDGGGPDLANVKFDVYFAYSSDGGATWSPNVRVTPGDPMTSDPLSDPRTTPFPNEIFIGDYNGLTAQGNTFFPLWTDLRNWDGVSNNVGDIYTARIVVGTVLYVDVDATGLNDGSSWVDAYTSLQDALAVAPVCTPTQIWVAEGPYKPDQGTAQTPGDRAATFQLESDVAILGGFAGTETSAGQRKPDVNVTILSGDIGAPGNVTDNSYHVVTASGVAATALLEGVVIEEGRADGPTPDRFGGGLYNNGGSPTLVRCIFRQNFAILAGGMYTSGGIVTLTDCTFDQNTVISPTRGGGAGGAIYGDTNSTLVLTNCGFTANFATIAGGALFSRHSTVTMADCTFAGNSTAQFSGGVDMFDCTIAFQGCNFTGNWTTYFGGSLSMRGSTTGTGANCTFQNNSAASGGGVYFQGFADPKLFNCVFLDNTATNGGGTYVGLTADVELTNGLWRGNQSSGNGGGTYHSSGDADYVNCTFYANVADADISGAGNGGALFLYGNAGTSATGKLTNCILWGDTAVAGAEGYLASAYSTLTVAYSDVQGGEAGIPVESGSMLAWDTGNIDEDPLFVSPGSGDLRLGSGSPCIDAVDNTALPPDTADLDGDGDTAEDVPTDLDGNLRIVGADVDMGAYEAP